jgi:hypothetical protein
MTTFKVPSPIQIVPINTLVPTVLQSFSDALESLESQGFVPTDGGSARLAEVAAPKMIEHLAKAYAYGVAASGIQGSEKERINVLWLYMLQALGMVAVAVEGPNAIPFVTAVTDPALEGAVLPVRVADNGIPSVAVSA